MSRSSIGAVAASLAVLLLAGCYGDRLHGEEQQVTLLVHGLTAGPNQVMGNSTPVLEASPVCVTPCLYGAKDDETEPEARACYAQRAEGDATLDGDCLHLGGPGEVIWHFDRMECDAEPEEPLLDDRVRIQVVGAHEVEARPVRVWDDLLLDLVPADEGWRVLGAPLPEDARAQHGDQLGIVEGGSLDLALTLETLEGVRVARPDDERFAIEGAASWGEGEGEESLFTPSPGSAGELVLEVGGRGFLAGSWRTVPPDEIASIELSVILEGLPEERTAPLGVRVTARDAAGRLLDAAPVTWRQRGDPLALAPFSGDIYLLGDACVPPERQVPGRSTTLIATAAGHEARLAFDWDGSGEDVDEETFERSEHCPPGCGCASRAGVATLAWVPLLLGVLPRRRRPVRAPAQATFRRMSMW